MENAQIEYITLIIDIALAFTAVITLFFLLWQTVLLKKQIKIANEESKLANKLANNQAYQFRYQLYMEMDRIVIENPKFKKLISNNLFLQKHSNGEVNDEKSKELAFIELVMNLAQLSFFQHKDELMNSELDWVKELIQNENIIEYWNGGLKCKYREDFESFVNSEIRKIKTEQNK